MQGPLREDFTRISTRSSVENLCRIRQERLREEFRRMSEKARLPVYPRIYKENATDLELENHSAQTLCQPAQVKDNSQEPFYARIYRKNAALQDRCAQCVRACEVETHFDKSQGLFARESTGKKRTPKSQGRQYAGDQMEHRDQAPALILL